MATIDRFKGAIKNGKITADSGMVVNLSAQMKYDYLAAVHTMDQIEELNKTITARLNKREELKSKLLTSCRNSLKALVEDENGLKDIKNIDRALKVLHECRNELVKMDGQTHEDNKLAKIIEDGVSAGR